MILLIPNSSSEYSAPSLPFKFHYDSINSDFLMTKDDMLITFKFHYDSINSRYSDIKYTFKLCI